MGKLVVTAESKRFLKTACIFFSVAIVAGLAWLIFNNVKGGESSVRKADAIDYAGVDDGGYASRGDLDIPQTSEDEKSYVTNGAAEVVDIISDNYSAIVSNFSDNTIASVTNSEASSFNSTSSESTNSSSNNNSGSNESSNSGSDSGNNSESNNGSENNTGENNNENPGNNENLIDNGNSENSDLEEPELGASDIVPMPTEEPYITCGWDLTGCVLEGEGVEEEDNVLYMQDITEDILEELPVTDDLDDIQWIEMVDKRTGEHYQVYKFHNRNGFRSSDYALYMSTPLNIGSTEKPMLLTSENTEIDDPFYILPVKHSSGLLTINEVIVDKIPESLTDGSDAITRNVYESVCPKGWILPMQTEDYSLHDGYIEAETDFQTELAWMDSLNPIASSSMSKRNGTVMRLSTGFSQPLEDDQEQRVEVRCIYKQRKRRIYKKVTFDLNGGYAYDDNDERITSFVYSIGAYEGAENFILQSGYVNHYERYRDDGKVFRGWSDIRNGSAMVSPTSEFMLSPFTDPTTMYAVWAEAQKPLYPSW